MSGHCEYWNLVAAWPSSQGDQVTWSPTSCRDSLMPAPPRLSRWRVMPQGHSGALHTPRISWANLSPCFSNSSQFHVPPPGPCLLSSLTSMASTTLCPLKPASRRWEANSGVCVSVCVCVCLLSHVWLFVTPWPLARQTPVSMGSSRQEHWDKWPFPPPGNLPNPGIKPMSPGFPALAGGFFTNAPPTWFSDLGLGGTLGLLLGGGRPLQANTHHYRRCWAPVAGPLPPTKPATWE